VDSGLSEVTRRRNDYGKEVGGRLSSGLVKKAAGRGGETGARGDSNRRKGPTSRKTMKNRSAGLEARGRYSSCLRLKIGVIRAKGKSQRQGRKISTKGVLIWRVLYRGGKIQSRNIQINGSIAIRAHTR